jgi:hypothetical protein
MSNAGFDPGASKETTRREWQETAAAWQRAVLATDISSNILEYVAGEASAAGHSNVAMRTMDGEDVDLDDGSSDAVVSRVRADSSGRASSSSAWPR